ncbi:sigma E regulatory protein, MucB/RseB [Alteromonadaceae bacterium Bs31]|nr:sigma E regulatory protein, MucB/RseB [Alteromonadaceae bacterium Bs31]
MKNTNLILRALLFAGLTLCASSVVHAVETEPTVDRILAKLTESMRSSNYRGIFTFEHGGSLETMEVSHWVLDGIEYERYLLLNGPEQTLLRSGRRSDCESLAGRMLRGATLSASDGKAFHFDEYYHAYFRGYERVAGRNVAIVQLVPKDNLRYGLSLAVDVESGVLLKALVMSSKKVLERMQFVAFENEPAFTEEELADIRIEKASERACRTPLAGGDASKPAASFDWQPAWVPLGFTLASSSHTEKDGEVHTFTDGLSSFSVFANSSLVPENPNIERIPRGVAQRGATLVLMDVRRIGEQFLHVTLVGEIPEYSAVRILQSIEKLPGKAEQAPGSVEQAQ